ncbi:MAG: hypothetical protein HUJ53_06110, partial [Holdemanella sp.]|nr:hypothetical protein [Holdemanella sp.]
VLYHYIHGTGILTDIEFSYLMEKEEYEKALPEVESEINRLVKEAKQFSSDPFNQELYVYEYLTNHCTYDETVKHFSDAYGVLIEKTSACLGFSRTMEWILNELGIPCLVAAGHGEDETLGHAWNVIYMNDGYYCLDVTSDIFRKEEISYNTYRFFNSEDTFFNQNYAFQDSVQYVGIPECKDVDMNYYHHKDLYIYEMEDVSYTFTTYLARFIELGGRHLLKIESKENYEFIKANMQSLYERASALQGYPSINISYAMLDDDHIFYFIIEGGIR